MHSTPAPVTTSDQPGPGVRYFLPRCGWGPLALLHALLASATAIPAAPWSYTTASIPVRDGQTLAADRWFASDGDTPKPVILIQTPYNKNAYRLGAVPGFGGANFPANTNYHFVIVDWRGFYGSAGAAAAGYNRGLDGYDCVEWIAAQAWSNGRVGTWGSSALGYIQYQTAAQHPPHLVCCTIQVKDFQTRYDNFYYGGVYRKEHVESVGALGLTSPSLILAHPTLDLFWQATERLSATADTVSVPVLVVGGWFDHFPDTVLRSFADLVAASAEPVRGQHRLIMGPWLHGAVGEAAQGVLSFTNATQVFDTEVLFWDRTLRQLTNAWDQQPAVQFYQMGENLWHAAAAWASVPRSPRMLHLRAGGLLTEVAPDAGESPDVFVSDPADPAPALGGSRFSPFDQEVLEGPQDLAPSIESRPDVLVYSTAPLTQELRLNGAIRVLLHVASDRTDTDVAVRLTDVYPDGRSLIMTQGIRRGRFRNSLSTAELLTPGVVYPIEILLQDLARTFRRGHRLRLVVSSGCYPHFDLNFNDGGPLYTNGTPLIATNTLRHDATYPSRIEFHVLPEDLDADGLPDLWEADAFGSLDRDGSQDFDADRATDREEYLAGTDPADSRSVLALRLISATVSTTALEFTATAGRTYTVLYLDSLGVPPWQVLTPVGAALTNGSVQITDAAPAPAGRYYRLVTPAL